MSDTQHSQQSSEHQERNEHQENSTIYQRYRERLINLFSSNSKRLREEFLSIRQKADEYLRNVGDIVKTNTNVRKLIRSKRNYYTNYVFSYLGYKYQTHLENANFFHFASQAWIINVFPSQESEESRKEYFELLRDILEKQYEDLQIQQTLEHLTGTYYITDPAIKLSEIRLLNIFLRNLREVEQERRKQDIDRDLTKTQFDQEVMDLLTRAVNWTINEVDQLDSHSSLHLYNTYIRLSHNRDEFTLQNYIRSVAEGRNRSAEDNKANEDTNTFACTTYFTFAQTSLNDLLYDIDLFNQRSKSIISKLTDIFNRRKESVQQFASCLYSQLGGLMTNVRDGIRYDNLKSYYQKTYSKVKDASVSSVAVVSSKVNNYKEWVADNKYFKGAFYYPTLAFEKASTYGSSSRVYLYDHVYSPAKNVTVTLTGNSYNFVVRNVENARENSKRMYESLRENLGRNYSQMKDNLSSYVKFEEENDDTIIIKISKKDLREMRVRKIFNSVMDQISVVKFKENVNFLIEKTKETSLIMKDNLLERYRRFLTLFDKHEEKRDDQPEHQEAPSSQQNEQNRNQEQPSEQNEEKQPSSNQENNDNSSSAKQDKPEEREPEEKKSEPEQRPSESEADNKQSESEQRQSEPERNEENQNRNEVPEQQNQGENVQENQQGQEQEAKAQDEEVSPKKGKKNKRKNN